MPVVVEDDEPVKKTTEVNYMSVMVRNIPNRYSQQMLRTEIDKVMQCAAALNAVFGWTQLPDNHLQQIEILTVWTAFRNVFPNAFHNFMNFEFKVQSFLKITLT